jgi:chromosome segregation ATPase
MYIDSISLYGFRSSPERITLSCRPGVNNFQNKQANEWFDGLRWALGERRLAVLGCRKLEELLFAGDQVSRRLNYNEVSADLNNDDKSLPIDWQHVEVMRRYHRSVESEYFLNRQECRLKDLQEFLSKHLNVKGISFWGSHDREQMAKWSGDELRTLFDLTAGFGTDRLRIKEVEHKINQLEESLQIIKSLISDLSIQLEKLNQADSKQLPEQVRVEERLTFLLEQEEGLTESIDNQHVILNGLRENIRRGFEANFPKLQRAVRYEMNRWLGANVELVLSIPDDIVLSGIFLSGLPSTLSSYERSAAAWALWSAFLQVLPVPVAAIQIDLVDAPFRKMLSAIIDKLAINRQILIFGSDKES